MGIIPLSVFLIVVGAGVCRVTGEGTLAVASLADGNSNDVGSHVAGVVVCVRILGCGRCRNRQMRNPAGDHCKTQSQCHNFGYGFAHMFSPLFNS